MSRAPAFALMLALVLPGAAGADELRFNVVQESLELKKADIVAAEAILQEGRWIVEVRFSHAAAVKFADITGRNNGKPMQIVVGDRIVSTAMIRGPIAGGTMVLSGNFGEADAKAIAARLK